MNIRKFWPWDLDQEVEIYENPSWDMPGLRRSGRKDSQKAGKGPVEKKK